MKLAQTLKEDARHLQGLIQRGIEAWIEAGQFIAKRVDENPDYIAELSDAMPDISPEHLARFEQIGRKQLHPKLLLSSSPGIRALCRLPYPLQERYLKEPVELFIQNGEKPTTLRVDVRNLTKLQTDQAFSFDGVRTVAAQRAWLEDRVCRNAVPTIESNLPYRTVGKKLVVVTPCTIDRRDLARLLAELE